MKTTNVPTRLASIAFDLRYFNMTDEEEDAYAPFSYQNQPQPVSVQEGVKWRRPFYDRTGMQLRECEGKLETFADGSTLRTNYGDKLAEIATR